MDGDDAAAGPFKSSEGARFIGMSLDEINAIRQAPASARVRRAANQCYAYAKGVADHAPREVRDFASVSGWILDAIAEVLQAQEGDASPAVRGVTFTVPQVLAALDAARAEVGSESFTNIRATVERILKVGE